MLSTQPLGREKEQQIDFNHMASDSINFACVMKPNEKSGCGSSGEFSWFAILYVLSYINVLGN